MKHWLSAIILNGLILFGLIFLQESTAIMRMTFFVIWFMEIITLFANLVGNQKDFEKQFFKTGKAHGYFMLVVNVVIALIVSSMAHYVLASLILVNTIFMASRRNEYFKKESK